MKKSDLKNKICSNLPNHSPLDISLAVDLVSKCICDGLKKNERIEIRGFGSFSIRNRNPIRGRNPKTGSSVELGKRRIPYFRAAKALNFKINH
tara:strand:- start:228 stop:506 length:279 start_codon:yes stop_codon:yes gene_type:complete